MNETQKIARIFRPLDTSLLVEVALIALGAVALIILCRKLFTYFGARLHGNARLYLLGAVPQARLVIIVAAIFLIVPKIMEPSVQNMVALLGTLGLAIGFALKDYVSSLVAGIVAVNEMPYRPGDWIEINGAYGEVTHIGMRAVDILTPDDTRVVIPHQKLWKELIYNANSGRVYLQCVADFHLHPLHDGQTVRSVLHDVAFTSPYLCTEKPVVVVAKNEPWGTHYRIRAYPLEPRQQFQFITDMTLRGKAALSDLGVSFAVIPAFPEKSA